jgi:hypothetical protein
MKASKFYLEILERARILSNVQTDIQLLLDTKTKHGLRQIDADRLKRLQARLEDLLEDATKFEVKLADHITNLFLMRFGIEKTERK